MRLPKLRQKVAQTKPQQHEVNVSFYLVWHPRGLFNLSPLATIMERIDWLQVARDMLADSSEDEIFVEPTSNERMRIYVRRLVKIPVTAEEWAALTEETEELKTLREIAASKKRKRAEKSQTPTQRKAK